MAQTFAAKSKRHEVQELRERDWGTHLSHYHYSLCPPLTCAVGEWAPSSQWQVGAPNVIPFTAVNDKPAIDCCSCQSGRVTEPRSPWFKAVPQPRLGVRNLLLVEAAQHLAIHEGRVQHLRAKLLRVGGSSFFGDPANGGCPFGLENHKNRGTLK